MSNYAWVLEVRPGYEEEYKKRHDELWPEMKEMLREAGVRNYNIFRHGLTLFGYFETDDLKKSIKHITPRTKWPGCLWYFFHCIIHMHHPFFSSFSSHYYFSHFIPSVISNSNR